MNFRFHYNKILIKAGFHLLFWATSFYVLLYNYASSSEFTRIDYIYTGIFLLAPVFAVYINFYLLFPRFFQKGKYVQYLALLAILILLSMGIHYFSFNVLADLLFKNYYIISYFDAWQIARTLIIFLGITTLAHLSQSWFELYESRARLQEVEKEKALYQLESLRAQINPHFLFNSLNSIYSLALKKSQQTPGVILLLSDVLRYVIYESNAECVELEKELEFIRNYIELQKLRTNISEVVSYRETGDSGNIRVAPLIFIVFIENAFKHGLKGDTANQFINIIFNISRERIEFISENNIGRGSHVKKEEYNGLGLENVKKRLDLMYPGKHELGISAEKGKYAVQLIIYL